MVASADNLNEVLLPFLLSLFATLMAAVMAYGVDPAWAHHSWGLGLIMLSRRLQWPLIALSLILCLLLFGLVISGKRRVWWLIGLAPVLVLFGHRFLSSSINRYTIADEPQVVTAAAATFLGDGDYVVGVILNGEAYAYPYACLYCSPVVVQSDREHRLLLLWSPQANAATALLVAREMKARDLDIASDPANGLLIYDGRSGQFIASVTGLTPHGDKPPNCESRLNVTKTTWQQWRTMQPETRVMLPLNGSYAGPTRPLPPQAADSPQVVLVGGAAPIAINSRDITFAPLNVTNGDAAILILRDPATGRIRAFDRHLDKDLVPQFKPNTDRKRKTVALIDSDTNAGWSIDGRCVDGHSDFKGKKLTPLEVQEDVNLDAAKFWYHNLKIQQPATQPSPGLG